MEDENLKKLNLEQMGNVTGGVGFDAPYEFLESIPDENLRRAWEVAFAVPRNYSSWEEYKTYLDKPNFASSIMRVGGVEGISEREFLLICRSAMLIQVGKMDYPTF